VWQIGEHMIKYFLCLCACVLLGTVCVAAGDYPRNTLIDEGLWNTLKPHFLPYDHPVRHKLDKIFSKFRALKDIESMERAGFKKPYPRKWTRLVVTKHPKIPGYVFKAYLDKQNYHRKMPEYHFWLLRIEGVERIRNEITKRQLEGIFKVPRKWIYPVPQHPSPPKKYVRKNFILVEEDMDIYSEKENEMQWKTNPKVNEQMLLDLVRLLNDLGLWDCPKPDNMPFCKDGRIAFIDTQTFFKWPVKFFRLTPVLPPHLQPYWENLTKSPG
jgi:hypothetical protein